MPVHMNGTARLIIGLGTSFGRSRAQVTSINVQLTQDPFIIFYDTTFIIFYDDVIAACPTSIANLYFKEIFSNYNLGTYIAYDVQPLP